MPSEGLNWVPRNELLSFEEIDKLLTIFSSLGITKLRFTGGEPFLRKDFMQLLRSVTEKNLFEKISITTNGTLTAPHVAELKSLGVHAVNLSVDTFDEKKFQLMTRRDDFSAVMKTFELLLAHNITTKINAVIMEGKNEEDILPLVAITEKLPVDVRFIEEMPFNGHGDSYAIRWTAKSLIELIREHHPSLKKAQDEVNSTSMNYSIDGHLGNVGVIAAWSRSFCGTCNRIRLTPKGSMKTCLYDNGQINLRDLLRAGMSAEDISEKILKAVGNRAIDGREAEKLRNNHPVQESMATIGG
jgi:molybdenum cofactor biosynthesis enzyme MoaA